MSEVVINNSESNVESDLMSSVKAPIYKKETKKPGKRKSKSTKGKTPAYKFDRNKYMQIEKYDETIPVRQLNRRGQLVVEQTPTGRTLEREVLSDEFISEWGGGSRKNKSVFHKAKCRLRTCEFFEVSPEQIEKGYTVLSGKKIDGFWATDLIDRFGWSDGEQMSRDMLRIRYGKTNRNSVDIAQEKLYDILNTADISKAYVDLIKDIKQEFSEELRNNAVYGE